VPEHENIVALLDVLVENILPGHGQPIGATDAPEQQAEGEREDDGQDLVHDSDQ
jgi:hypothetical protein